MNATTGLSPWSLAFGRVPTGPITILKNHWIGTEKLLVSFGKSTADYLQNVQERVQVAEQYAITHADIEQKWYLKYYNLQSTNKRFEIGENVLVLIPGNTASKLFSRWSPAKVIAKRSPYSYQVELNGAKRYYHANHLHRYKLCVETVCA